MRTLRRRRNCSGADTVIIEPSLRATGDITHLFVFPKAREKFVSVFSWEGVLEPLQRTYQGRAGKYYNSGAE